MPRHPIQPVVRDKHNVIRFKSNAIVRFLYDSSPNKMNELSLMPFTDEDWEQFAQLIGYSVSGAGELSYVTTRVIKKADARAARLMKKAK